MYKTLSDKSHEKFDPRSGYKADPSLLIHVLSGSSRTEEVIVPVNLAIEFK
jgi:hypothetical protein